MAGASASSSDRLMAEGQFSGKLFWLNIPSDYDVDYQQLRGQLQDRTFYRSVSEDMDLGSVYVPDIFIQDGEITKTIVFQSIELINDRGNTLLFGTAVLDEPYTVEYQGQEILILGTTRANFIIFQFQSHHYIEFLCAREVAENIASVLRDESDVLGPAIRETRLRPDAIEAIRRALSANLMDTEFGDFPEPELTSLRMRGYGFEGGDEYDRQSSRGRIQNHMMQTEDWIPGESKVLSVSRDGLIRSYSKVTLSRYMGLLKNYVIPHIQREQDSSVLSIWGDGTIYTEATEEDET